MNKKFNQLNNTSHVVFSLPKEAVEGVSSVVVMGDFSEWHPIPMFTNPEGTFTVEIEIPMGREYHFRYQIDNHHWENDWSADRYETSPMYHHIENSVLSLLKEEVSTTPDDLTKIEGIGPKIAELLKNVGIITFEKLFETSEETLKRILAKSGKRFQVHNPSTWSAQAKLAANGDWVALKKWQEELIGGKKG